MLFTQKRGFNEKCFEVAAEVYSCESNWFHFVVRGYSSETIQSYIQLGTFADVFLNIIIPMWYF